MLSFKNTIAGTVLAVSALSISSQALDLEIPSGSYTLDPTHASLVWKVNHFGLSNYTARFTKFDVALDLNTADVSKSSVSVSIDPTSVKTDYVGEMDFDGEISNDAKFLNSAAFPEITFVSRKVEQTGNTTALIHGDMTMLGVTKPVTLKAALNGAMPQHPYAKVPAVGFQAEGSVKRSDFGFEYLVPYVGDDVSFVIEAEFIKAE